MTTWEKSRLRFCVYIPCVIVLIVLLLLTSPLFTYVALTGHVISTLTLETFYKRHMRWSEYVRYAGCVTPHWRHHRNIVYVFTYTVFKQNYFSLYKRIIKLHRFILWDVNRECIRKNENYSTYSDAGSGVQCGSGDKEITEAINKPAGKKWMIKLNETESTHVKFTSKKIEPTIPVIFNNKEIPWSNTAKYLWMTLHAVLRCKKGNRGARD